MLHPSQSSRSARCFGEVEKTCASRPSAGRDGAASSAFIEHLIGLDGKADGYVGLAVGNLKEMTAVLAMKPALGACHRSQLNAAVASVTFGAGDIGLYHG